MISLHSSDPANSRNRSLLSRSWRNLTLHFIVIFREVSQLDTLSRSSTFCNVIDHFDNFRSKYFSFRPHSCLQFRINDLVFVVNFKCSKPWEHRSPSLLVCDLDFHVTCVWIVITLYFLSFPFSLFWQIVLDDLQSWQLSFDVPFH